MPKAREHPSTRNMMLSVGAFLVSSLGPAFIAPEIQFAGFFVGVLALLYGLWPLAIQFHLWMRSCVGHNLEWFIWLILLALLFGASLIVNAWIISMRYNLKYEVCFGHDIQNTPSGPKVSAIHVWVRLINSETFPIVMEVTEHSLGLGTARSIEQFSRETTLVGPENVLNPIGPTALPVLTNKIVYNPPISPRLQAGNLRYVVKYGTDNSKLDRTMLIKGRIVYKVSPDGNTAIGAFTPDGDSAPTFRPKMCRVLSDLTLAYDGY